MRLSTTVLPQFNVVPAAASSGELEHELFLDHLGQARDSADEAYRIASDLSAGEPVNWQGGAQGMLRDLAGMVANATSTAEEATAYLDADHAAIAHARGAIDALTGASKLLEDDSAGAASPAQRATAAIDLIEAGQTALWESWVAADGPED